MDEVFEVFVPGGLPTVTYNPRVDTGVETTMSRYLKAPNSLLSVSGPTKSGKTVLVKRVLGERPVIWLEGASLTASDDLWSQLAHHLNLFSGEQRHLGDAESDGTSVGGTVDAKLVKGSGSAESQHTIHRSRTQSREIPLQVSVVEALKNSRAAVVVDDFHYMNRDVQREFARGLRPCLLVGVPVILIAVPHRAYDAIKAEPEMIGRVTNMHVALWAKEELAEIARLGFDELQFEVPKAIIKDFVDQAAGSPHLMQEFCRELCLTNGQESAASTGDAVVLALGDRSSFFSECASRAAVSTDFYALAKGLTTRGQDRKQFSVPWLEHTVDIYRLVIYAIIEHSPKETISYSDMRTAISAMDPSEMPQKNQITNVLRAFDRIAKDSEGEPVLEWIDDEETLVVVDPFFAFFTRWMAGLVD